MLVFYDIISLYTAYILSLDQNINHESLMLVIGRKKKAIENICTSKKCTHTRSKMKQKTTCIFNIVWRFIFMLLKLYLSLTLLLFFLNIGHMYVIGQPNFILWTSCWYRDLNSFNKDNNMIIDPMMHDRRQGWYWSCVRVSYCQNSCTFEYIYIWLNTAVF